MRRRAQALVLATHPLPCVAVTAFVAATAAAAGVGADRTVLLAVAILTGQASIGWANDYVDAGRDRAAARPDKPLARGDISDTAVGRAAALALAADVPLSLAVGWRPGAAHLVAVGSAWMYDLGLKPTPASALPYALSFGLLPVIIATALPGDPTPRPLVVAAAALMGVAAHFANTVGDAADDALTGVRGLPQSVGPAGSLGVAAAVLAAAAGCLVVATSGAALTVAAAAVAVAALVGVAAVARRVTARRLAFRAVILAVALLIAAFVVDGGHRLVG